MATTPVYNWPTPDDTDLVKDGAKAIRDLGNAIDTTVSSVPTGLVHIETQTITGTPTAVSFNNVFTSNYNHYRIVSTINRSTTAEIRFRFRTSGTDFTGNNYYSNWAAPRNDADSFFHRRNADASFSIIGDSNTGQDSQSFDVFNPEISGVVPVCVGNFFRPQSMNAYVGGFGLAQTDSRDGFSILVSAGTITSGVISVYGYRK
jgi:hypothetical protein